MLSFHEPMAVGETRQFGTLALWLPLLQQLDVAGVIDRHLPADPQLEFSHGKVLSLLLAARLDCPTALSHVGAWAEESGADILWNIPADKLNDDRLGRSLDAFFPQRHSILAALTDNVLRYVDAGLHHLHFDTTHLVFYGAYENSRPRPLVPVDELRGDSAMSAAHIGHGYLTRHRMIQAGLLALVDELGALPVFQQCLDGQRNGFSAIREHYQLLRRHVPLPDELLFVSDRGTCSAEHIGRLYRHGHHVLCSAPWHDYRGLYEQHAEHLSWRTASFLSIEQQRRRAVNSALPREDYQLAVVHDELRDPCGGSTIPTRVIFVRSSAGVKEARQRRDKNIALIREGLERIADKVVRAHPRTDPTSVARQVARLFGKKAAAAYFRWQLIPLTAEERATLTPIGPGFKTPSHRLEYTFDAVAAELDARHDGLAALVTTASLTRSGDELFSIFKRQNCLELLHHQWKTPLAVRPVFLKSPERVEALVALLHLALQVYQVLERRYRQRVNVHADEDDRVLARRTTAETLLRAFRSYGLIVAPLSAGQTVHATPLTSRQRQILTQLSLPTPNQILARHLPRPPTP
jgi:hypothetical protein